MYPKNYSLELPNVLIPIKPIIVLWQMEWDKELIKISKHAFSASAGSQQAYMDN